MKYFILILSLFLISCDGYKGLHRENYGRSNLTKMEQNKEIQNHYVR